MPEIKVLILIPSFFDLPTAESLVNEISKNNSTGTKLDFIIIDEALGAELARQPETYLRHINDYRMGAQSAIVATLIEHHENLNNYSYICTLDGDGEDSPSDFSRLMDQALLGKDIVLASRTKRHSTLAFKMGHLFFQFIFLILTGHILQTGNFAIVESKWLQKNLERPEFALSYAGALAALPANRVIVPCAREPRRAGKSKMRLQDSITDGLRLLLPFSSRIAARSFLLFLLTTLIAFFSCCWIIYANLLGISAPGWTTSALVLVGLAMTASAVISLVTMGIMAILLLSRKNKVTD